METGDLGGWPGVEVDEGAGGDEVFTAAIAGREEEGDIGDLLGEEVDGAVNPDDLFVGVCKGRPTGGRAVPAQPGVTVRAERFRYGRTRPASARNVKAK